MKMNNEKKAALLSHRQIVMFLMGLTVCYQMIYQAIMWRALQNEEVDSDKACAAPGASDPIAAQPMRCLEMHLFQSWQQESSFLNKARLSELRRGGEDILHVKPLFKAATDAQDTTSYSIKPVAMNTTRYPASLAPIKSHFDKADINADGVLDLEELVTARSQMGHQDPVADAHRVIGLWDQNHDEKITLEEFLDYTRPHWQDQVATTVQDQSSTQAAVLSHTDSTTSRGPNQDHATDVTAAPPTALHHFGEIDTGDDDSSRRRWTPVTEWAANLVGLQQSMQARAEQLERKHRLHAAQRAEERRKWRQEEFDRLEGEVLESLNRSRNTISPFTEDLMASQARLEEQLRRLNSTRAHNRTKGSSDAGATPRGDFKKEVLPTTAPRLRGQFKSLSWPAVHSWHQVKAKGSAVVVGWKDLHGARWSGMIPKVSCITVIPWGRASKIRMSHFIDNFRLQEYEGAQQLVLVYHHADEEARKLVSTYADGSYIKGTAAFGDGELPTTVAFRYGAWVSDGDVVARWDFDDFHHPWRLSLQVRALALASRPASFFRHPAASQSADQPNISASSMLGERAWMREHWHPLLSAEAALQSFHASQMVEVDVPALRKSVRPSENTQTFSTLPSECFESALNAKMDEDGQHQLQKNITKKLGREMGDTYHGLLAKRAEVEDKLLALCADEAESLSDDDGGRRKQLGRLVAARAGIQEHFQTLSALFQPAP
mmetsp:Transcript_76310/g.138986  ORF Transcript_76310/g.138986 Transcript_76310/m.138986 type:complete len:718 (-) Transcript_76310:57-2210(-)